MTQENIHLDYYSLERIGERLHEGEPVFVLRASDIRAAESVRRYAEALLALPGLNQEQFDKAIAALHVSFQMSKWQQENPAKVKLPDNPPTITRPSRLNEMPPPYDPAKPCPEGGTDCPGCFVCKLDSDYTRKDSTLPKPEKKGRVRSCLTCGKSFREGESTSLLYCAKHTVLPEPRF